MRVRSVATHVSIDATRARSFALLRMADSYSSVGGSPSFGPGPPGNPYLSLIELSNVSRNTISVIETRSLRGVSNPAFSACCQDP